MPGRDEHLRVAGRFESFAKSIQNQPYNEWLVIVWFHIALHYVDAVLATKGHRQVAGHSDRWAKCELYPELQPIASEFHQLYKDAKEARYDAGEYTLRDLEPIQRRYERIRATLRGLLGL